MNARADFDPEIADLVGPLRGASDRTSRSIKGGVEAVSGRVVLGTVPSCERLSHNGVVRFEDLFPSMVAESCLLSRRIGYVREQHRGQDGVEFDAFAFGADELSDPHCGQPPVFLR